MASVYSVSSSERESPSTDEEMPILIAISWVESVEPENPDTQGPSTRSDLTALLNTTIEDFFRCWQTKPHLVHILNRYLLQRHGVYVERLTKDNSGSISVVFF